MCSSLHSSPLLICSGSVLSSEGARYSLGQSAHHGISGKGKPSRFPCCAVSPLACPEPSTEVTSNRGARAKHSPRGQPNVSSAPPTIFFALAIQVSEAQPKTAAGQPEGGQPPFTWKHGCFPARLVSCSFFGGHENHALDLTFGQIVASYI